MDTYQTPDFVKKTVREQKVKDLKKREGAFPKSHQIAMGAIPAVVVGAYMLSRYKRSKNIVRGQGNGKRMRDIRRYYA